MYSQRELIRIGAHKTALLRAIAARRERCVAATAQIARPLAWLDRTQHVLRRLSSAASFAAIPLKFMFSRALPSRNRAWVALIGAVAERALVSAFSRRNH